MRSFRRVPFAVNPVRLALLGAAAFFQIAAPLSAAPAPCAAPEFRQLDFWLGEWDLTWPAAGANPAGRGTNRITKVLDGCVVEENFAAEGAGALVGRSLSTFDAARRVWRQTWVDNTGSYLDFEGTLLPEARSLSRNAVRNGRPTISRMRWVSVGPDSLDWIWEASADEGKTWKLLWEIHYVRRAPAKASAPLSAGRPAA